MGPIELGTILDIIFQKYCPSNHIVINNLYTIDIHNNQEHFILISDQENYYSYNYRMNKFLKISAIDLEKNIENKELTDYEKKLLSDLNKEFKKVRSYKLPWFMKTYIDFIEEKFNELMVIYKNGGWK